MNSSSVEEAGCWLHPYAIDAKTDRTPELSMQLAGQGGLSRDGRSRMTSENGMVLFEHGI